MLSLIIRSIRRARRRFVVWFHRHFCSSDREVSAKALADAIDRLKKEEKALFETGVWKEPETSPTVTRIRMGWGRDMYRAVHGAGR